MSTVGLYPQIEIVSAKKNSRNRAARIPDIKSLTITSNSYGTLTCFKVMLVIQEEFTIVTRSDVIIQKDNYRPHVSTKDLLRNENGIENRR